MKYQLGFILLSFSIISAEGDIEEVGAHEEYMYYVVPSSKKSDPTSGDELPEGGFYFVPQSPPTIQQVTQVHNYNTASPNITSIAESNQSSSVDISVSSEVSSYMTSIQNITTDGCLSLWENKLKLIFGSIVAAYLYIIYKVKSMEYDLELCMWSKWREGISMRGLYSIDDVDLVCEVLMESAGGFITKDMSSSIEPAKRFFYTVKEERMLLGAYKRWMKFARKIPLGKRLFCFSENDIDARVNKLDYLESKVRNFTSKLSSKNFFNSVGADNEGSDTRESASLL